MKLLLSVASLALLASVSACAAGTEPSHQAAQNGALPQLLLGFWHGVIAPLTLTGEIINEFAPGSLPWTFRFYEARGTAVLYDVGFFVGVFFGPSSLWTAVARGRGIRRRTKS